MNDFVQIQNDNAMALLCDARLKNVNIVTRERLVRDESRLPDKTLALEVLAYVTPRNGRKGIGVIVEKPEFSVESPGVTGPLGDILLEFLILEDRLTNLGPQTGAQIAADQVGQIIMDVVHMWADESTGTFQFTGKAMQSADDWLPLVAYRVRCRLTCKRKQTERVKPVQSALADGQLTLTCATEGAEIFYTTDESFPANSPAVNPESKKYDAPFAVESGDVIRAAAYVENLNVSPVRKILVP